MSKTIALQEYNKRASCPLDAAEFDLIEGMKSFGTERVAGAFAALTGRELELKDVELAILILDLLSALTPPVQYVNTGSGGVFNWPAITSRREAHFCDEIGGRVSH